MQRLVMVPTARWTRLVGRHLIAGLCALLTTSGAVSTATIAQGASYNLDAELLPRGSSAEIDMMPGRLGKLPVSRFGRYTVPVNVPHSATFRTSDCAGVADTGMVVTWTEGGISYTAFDNDGNTDGNGRCSLIDTGSHAGPVTYTVYVFSMTRATSFAKLHYSTGSGWFPVGTGDHYGGTVVRVGALQSGDFIQVQTVGDGAGDDATHMLLFQPPAPGSTRVAKAAIFNDGENTSDRDPRIVVDGSWSSPRNAVLIGKVSRNSSSLKGVETRVDLVRGPLEVNGGVASLSCSGSTCTGTPVPLPPGRYYASLLAKTPYPLGSVDANYAYALGTGGGDEDKDKCPLRPRGLRGNDRAFTAVLSITKDGVTRQRARTIPRGLLGDGEGYNRIVMEIDADGASSFSLDVTNKADDVTFSPYDKWEYVRNPEVNEIKVATWNFGFRIYNHFPYLNFPAQHPVTNHLRNARIAVLKNAADLLGTRGNLGQYFVAEPANQAPWQWEADVIAFQEFFPQQYEFVRDRLQERTAFGWSLVNAQTEVGELAGETNVLYGPVFVNEFLRPVGGIKYSDLQLDDGSTTGGRCNARWQGTSYDYACPLGFVGELPKGEIINKYRFAVPLKLIARRKLGNNANAGTDRPVGFFNWHLFHVASADDKRAENIENFILDVKYLMRRPADGNFRAGKCAFNKHCEELSNDQIPKHASTRFIVLGDSNMLNHQCGEFTWALRRLREEFGYAIDVSAATIDRNTSRTFDMHWSGGPITDARMSVWGPCNQRNGTWSKTVKADGATNGCPWQFQHRGNWNNPPPESTLPAHYRGSDSWYPWWAATFRNEKGEPDGGARLDVVFLVGRGWAYDDPVLSYKVMPHYDEPSPMNGGLGGGVELSYDSETCVGPVTGVKPSYAPTFSVAGCANYPGAPALRTDHIPTGARLRVWGR